MTPEEADKFCEIGNGEAAEFCRGLIDRFGTGPEYKAALSSAATALMFHAFRMAGPDMGAEAMSAILGDLSMNLEKLSRVKLDVSVSVVKLDA